jgi:beta-lactamase superfamily II metal-dependent hydrolase
MIRPVIKMNSRSLRVRLLLFVGFLGFAFSVHATTGLVQVHYLDVGRGDASLLLAPAGETVLIDGGGEGSAAVDHLRNLGITRVNLVIATNGNDEHIGGLIDVLKTLTVDQVATNGIAVDSAVFQSFDAAITASGARRVVVDRGDRLQVGALTLEIINPGPLPNPDPMESSIVVRVVCPEGPASTLGATRSSFLFTSDIDAPGESAILLSGLPVRSGVLQAAHHGTCSGSSAAFLAAVAPEMVVLSLGPNVAGEPCAEVLARLEATGATVWRTDQNGTVVVESACFESPRTSNLEPSASFVFSPSVPAPGQGISFDGTAATDPDGTITSYVWTFSDGTTAAGATATHSYASPGTYWVCLTVADNLGAVGTQCEEVAVPAVSDVRIDCVFYAGTQSLREADEYVQIVNLGTKAQDLSGWALRNLSRPTPAYTFRGVILQPGATIRVYTNEVHPLWGGFRFMAGGGIWSNSQSDTAALFDASGRLVSNCSYPLGDPTKCSGCSGR